MNIVAIHFLLMKSFVDLITAEQSQPRLYSKGKYATFKIVSKYGNSLASRDIASNHTVHSKMECSWKCLEEKMCLGFNYRSKSTNDAVNCQISNRTKSRDTSQNGDWWFYQDLETLVKSSNDKSPLSQVQCTDPEPLGMQSGKIPDSAITASSSYNENYKPYYGRLKRPGPSCSWAPTTGGRVGSWFQVDLGKMTTVTGLATQGQSCGYSEWATTYSVSYSTNGNKWTLYEESGVPKIFQGNKDKHSIVNNTFKIDIRSRFIRVLPKSWSKYPATRLELYGCYI
ncbi:lactadherin-like [Dendronephthya gigantea]|uniref:lactadherin-like n=1 Tax=Dendronephthya gigantea TaxID=151771 RepID=UPI00106D93D8|nr:lactadherin-like [Dendronephthya gigantea]